MSFDETRMAALRQRFLDSASSQAEEIEVLLQRDDRDGVRGLAHSLAGRAGMFGFPELGEVARRVDEAETGAFACLAAELLAALRRVAHAG
jgi:HPt (histidine-containing phosphotransfer) domain-containing protein